MKSEWELKSSETYYPINEEKIKRIVFTGLDDENNSAEENIRLSIAAGIKQAEKLKAQKIGILTESYLEKANKEGGITAILEGGLLSLYHYQHGKETKKGVEKIVLYVEKEDVATGAKLTQEVEATASGVYLSRDLVNMPPNEATPTYMAKMAQEIAETDGVKAIIGDREWAREREMGAFLAVAKGAGEPPKFIVLEYHGDRDDLPTVVVVGKGITFDSGGISLKPSQNMGAMKSDMAGASVVLGVMKAVSQLDLPLRIIGIAPCTENMPDADAYRPADVIRASNGKTIEIISTDAEGRMVLADGLVFAKKYSPDAVIDLATLTGSCVVALGKNVAAGLFTNDSAIRDRLLNSALKTNERLWPLPLYEDYSKTIKSKVADIKNSGGRHGGVGTSAAFLKEFVDYPWAHIDIAGMALFEKEKGYIPEGASGYGVRLIVDFLKSWNQ